MTEQSNKGFTFFLGSSSKDINEKDNPSIEYIVVQNDFLHKRVEELQKQVEELTKEKDEFEEDNESFEKRMISLRGITFNEFEMSKLLEQTIKGYKQTIIRHKNIQNDYKKVLDNEYITVTIFFALNYILDFIGFGNPLVLFYLMGISMIANSTALAKDISSKAKNVVLDSLYLDKEKEYQKLRQNQDYISTMINNM